MSKQTLLKLCLVVFFFLVGLLFAKASQAAEACLDPSLAMEPAIVHEGSSATVRTYITEKCGTDHRLKLLYKFRGPQRCEVFFFKKHEQREISANGWLNVDVGYQGPRCLGDWSVKLEIFEPGVGLVTTTSAPFTVVE